VSINAAIDTESDAGLRNAIGFPIDVSIKDALNGTSQARKARLAKVLSDEQMLDFSDADLEKLANGMYPLSVETVTDLVTGSRKLFFSDPLLQTSFTAKWLDRLSYPLCEPSGKNAEVLVIALSLTNPSIDIGNYLSTFIACLWQTSLNAPYFLDFLRPRMTEILYKEKLYNAPFGVYDRETLYAPGSTSLDAKLSNVVPDVGFELNALVSLMDFFGADPRIFSTTNFTNYCLRTATLCEQGIGCMEVKPSFYDFERLGCYFHIVRQTTNILNFEADTAELRKYGPVGTPILIGYYARKYALLKGNAPVITYSGDIYYTIGQILADSGKTFDYLLDTRTPEFQSLVNTLPGYYFVNATIGRNLLTWWNQQNGDSLQDAETKANDAVTDDWLTRLNAELVISLFNALRQIAGLPVARGTTTNVDYWKQNLGLNSTAQFAAKSVELYPYCQVVGDPNIGCLASVALGCYGNSELSCSQSYTTNIFRGLYVTMRYCSSYLGYQIRSSSCMTAANANAVSRAILAYGLNMPPQPGSTTSVMNAFYPSGKCDISLATGRGFIYHELTADGKDLTLYFGNLNNKGNVLKCADGIPRETLQASC